MSITALKCKDCGGSIAAQAGKFGARCLFCGSSQIDAMPLDKQLEQPDSMIPFSIGNAEANHSFKQFAASKFWAPGNIKKARLELEKLYLPAWIWSGDVESHYTGLRADLSTYSGKRPFSGQVEGRIEQALVPASTGVDIIELNAIRPFESEKIIEWNNDQLDAPYEIGLLTREAAIQEGMAVMKARHTHIISNHESASTLSNSCIVTSLEGRSSLLPIYIGVYRYKDRSFRILVNGVNGSITGTYPLSWTKIIIAIALFCGTLGAAIGFFI